MASMWKRIKMFVSARFCLCATPIDQDVGDGLDLSEGPISELTLGNGPVSSRVHSWSICSSTAQPADHVQAFFVSAPSPNHGSFKFSRSSCSICLEAMKPGQALFTAECSHIFHFSCIASNVRHGNQVCPICRAKWKDVPWQVVDVAKNGLRHGSRRRAPPIPRSHSHTGRLGSSNLSDEEQRRISSLLQIFDQSISRWQNRAGESDVYDDDEPLVQRSRDANSTMSIGAVHKVIIDCHTEVLAIPANESRHNFTVLVHLKATANSIDERCSSYHCQSVPSLHAPIDLVAVVDISGSMAGTKLMLLKQAMGFVIQTLSSADRLSVVVFSSSAKCIFGLRRMGEDGQQQALQAINSLVSSGGTNIAEGLRKGMKVLEDRKMRNPVSSIILLSDGQDTYSLNSQRHPIFFPNSRDAAGSRRFVPLSIQCIGHQGHIQIPVHTFGFGVDHDATIMHTIAEMSGGTFSFIQTEDVLQDAFAQCIGGLLSVVAQDVHLTITCAALGVHINNIKSGSYQSTITDRARHGVIKLGDLYAEEDRSILLELELPYYSGDGAGDCMPLLQADCTYKDPLTQETTECSAEELCISRPENLMAEQVVDLEVDRQCNRLRTTEVIAEARALAECGDFSTAQRKLQRAKTALENSVSARAGDHLSNVLESELTEIQGRMMNQYMYERTGRAYLLSAQSSHESQRATTRGESLDGLSHDYQTPSMMEMITQSQAMSFSELAASRPVQGNRPNNADAQNRSHVLLQKASVRLHRSS